jgi:hypothetical protein
MSTGAQNAYSCTNFVVCSTGMVNIHMVDSDERKVAGMAQALLRQEARSLFLKTESLLGEPTTLGWQREALGVNRR